MIDASEFLKWLLVYGVQINSHGGGGPVTPEEVQKFAYNYGAAGGSNDAFVVSLTPTVTSLVNGLVVLMSSGSLHNLTTTPTLQINSLTPTHIKLTGGTNPLVGDIVTDTTYMFVYNQAANVFELLNPSSSDINTGNDLPLWNASTNTPTLTSSTIGPEGFVYLVSVAGFTSLNGQDIWDEGDYAYFTGSVWSRLEMVEANRAQTLNNKDLNGAFLDFSQLTTSCLFVDETDNTKTSAINLSGKTGVTSVTSLYTGGTQTITYPTGDFTVAKAGDNGVGDVSPWVVGTSLTTAPYTSIQAAVNAASIVATSSNRQIVYIQAGNYTENVTLAGNVDICGLMASLTTNVYPVRITGTFTIPGTSVVAYNLENLSINNSASAPIVISGSSAITLTANNCLFNGTGQNGITSTNANAAILMRGVNIFSGNSPFVSSGGFLTMEGGYINGQTGVCVVNGTSTVVTLSNLNIDSRIGIPGTSCTVTLDNVAMNSLTQSCVNLSGTTNTALFQDCILTSSNGNVVDGNAGNIVTYSGLGFGGSSSLINQALTIQPLKGAYGQMTFDGGTTYMNAILAGNCTPTFPAGTYTLAKAGDNSIGNITPWIVGTSLTTAPYTSINTAITAAAAVANSGNQQFVYIQAGAYTENVVCQPYVHIIALGSVLSDAINLLPTASTVLLNGTIDTITAAAGMDILIDGLTLFTTVGGAAGIQGGGSSTVILNLRNCVIWGSHNHAVSNNNPSFKINIYNSSLQAASTFKVFNFTDGAIFKSGSKTYTTDTASTLAGAASVVLQNTYSADGYVLSGTAQLNAGGSSFQPPGSLAALNLSVTGTTGQISNSTISCAGTYAIVVVSGATYLQNFNVYTGTTAISNAGTITYLANQVGNLSFDQGVTQLNATLLANANLTIPGGSNQVSLSTPVQVTTNSVSMVSWGNYYIFAGGNVDMTLPTSSAAGDEVKIRGFNTGMLDLTNIIAGSSQQIIIGNSISNSSGGIVATGPQRNCITLTCIAPNLVWQADSVIGTWSVTT